MKVSWTTLFLAFATFFLAFNVVFAFAYWLDPTCIANRTPPGFLGDFFFSVETLATVGYGDMHPLNLYGHAIATVEIMVGLLTIASSVVFMELRKGDGGAVSSHAGRKPKTAG